MPQKKVELERIDVIELDGLSLLEAASFFSEKIESHHEDFEIYDDIRLDYCNNPI